MPQKEFVVPQGYFMMDDTQRGLSPGLYAAVSYDEAANYATPYLRDIDSGMRTDYTDSSNPLTTKGDIMSHDGVGATRVAVGNLWQTIIADPAVTTGIKWSDRFWMPNPSRRVLGWVQAYMDSTTIQQIDTTATVDANGTASAIQDTAAYINYASNAALGADAGWTQSAGQHIIESGMGPIITFVYKTGPNATDIDANTRFVIGVFDTSGPGTPMGQDFTGVVDSDYAIFAGPATTITGNSTGAGTQESQATGVAIAANTRYVCTIDMRDTASIKFYVDGVLKTTHTTVVPVTTSEFGCFMAIRNLDGTARNFRCSKIHVSHD